MVVNSMSSQNPLISVLVPVYNVQHFLPQCLDSILGQTYDNIEIVCVNDCATDKSGEILASYAQKYPKIQVYCHNKNLGLACARNTLLQHAKGEYICFIDSDDWVMPEYVEHLYQMARKNKADVVRCRYLIQDMTYGTLTPCEKKYKEFLKPAPSHDSARRFYAALDDTQAWLTLIRTEIIRKYRLSFLPHAIAEDFPFEVLLYQYAKKVVFTEKHLYVYRVGLKSALSADKSRMARDILVNMLNLCQTLKDRGFTQKAVFPLALSYTARAVRRLRKAPKETREQTDTLCRKAVLFLYENRAATSPMQRAKFTLLKWLTPYAGTGRVPRLAWWLH